jgi:hypothetical protein
VRGNVRLLGGIGILLALALARCGGSSDEQIDDSGSGGSAGAGAAGGVEAGGGSGGSSAGSGGSSTGSGGSAGAGPDGGTRYWTLERWNVELSAYGCPYGEGQTAFIWAEASIDSSCEHPGPIVARSDAATHQISVEAFIWVEHGVDCTAIDSFMLRAVPIGRLTEGSWTLTGANPLTIEIGGAPPPNVCTDPGQAGSTCFVDCDCENGLVCLDSPASCSRSCGEPCTDHGDCDPGEQCDASCEPRTDDACRNNADCGAGKGCLVPESGPAICDWSITVDQAARKPCLEESECAAGLHCVYTAGTGHCEVPCSTDTMRCPPLHECVSDATATPSHWVCEFIGE